MSASLRQAYEAAEYCLWIGGGELILRIGERNERALARLQQHAGLRHRGFIVTPCNPQSRPLATIGNRARLQTFRNRLQADAIRWLPAVNRDPEGTWPDEPGALLIDCAADYAQSLAADFGQNALVALMPDKAPALVWMD